MPITTSQPWTAEAEQLDGDSGPSVEITYRMPTGPEVLARRLCIAEAVKHVSQPKPGDGPTAGGESLIASVRLRNLDYEMGLALVAGMLVDGQKVPNPEDARRIIEEDGRFVWIVAKHSRYLFRDGAKPGAQGSGADSGTPEVSAVG